MIFCDFYPPESGQRTKTCQLSTSRLLWSKKMFSNSLVIVSFFNLEWMWHMSILKFTNSYYFIHASKFMSSKVCSEIEKRRFNMQHIPSLWFDTLVRKSDFIILNLMSQMVKTRSSHFAKSLSPKIWTQGNSKLLSLIWQALPTICDWGTKKYWLIKEQV